jgi:hypothetical protein
MFSGHVSCWLHRQPGTQGRTPDTLGAGGSRGRTERGDPRSCDTADGSAGRQLEHTALHRSQDYVAHCSNVARPRPCTARAHPRLYSAPVPLPASAQHAGPSSAAHHADTPRSDRSVPLDDTAAVKTRLPVPSLRAPALPQDAAHLMPANSPATASLPDESRPQHRCRSRLVAGSAFTPAGRTSITAGKHELRVRIPQAGIPPFPAYK